MRSLSSIFSILYFLKVVPLFLMKRIGILYALFLSLLVCNIGCHESRVLFQQDSDDWKTHGDAEWTFSDGVLVGKVHDGAGFVMAESSYRDFALELEFNPDSTINSGIFIRCANKELSAVDCHEINIWDLHPNQDYRTGAIVAKEVPQAHVETVGKWNTYRIRATKNHIQVWVNDRLTADSSYEYPTEGYIALQAMGTGEIKFRNIRIKTLK